jgi:hypothetical protein
VRNAFGIAGLFCGVIVVALVARYGYKTTDDITDAMIVAFLYAVIAAFGLAGHPFAVFLWRHSKVASMAAGVVAVASLGLNLSNSLGAIAGRNQTAQMETIEKNRKIRAAETDLARLKKLRDDMPVFVTTDQAAVDAAKRAADTAETQRKAECDTRGKPALECRKREDAEREANAKFTKATQAKAATDAAAKLEAEAKVQRELLAKLGPIVKVDVQGSAIASLFRLPDEEAGFLAKVQQFWTAAVVELIILVCLIGWEVSRPREEPRPGGSDTTAVPVIEPEPVTPARLPPPPRPRLAAPANERPAGGIPEILAAILEPAKGHRVEAMDELYPAYTSRCAAESKRAVTPEQFVDPARQFCSAMRIKVLVEGDGIYLMGVRLAQLDKPQIA